MKKYLPIVATLLLIIPSVAFASWWNPISWNWSALFNSPSSLQVQTQVQTVSTTTLPTTSSSTQTSVIATTSINIVATSTPPASQPVKKVIQKVFPTPVITSPTPSASISPATQTGSTCPQGYAWNSEYTSCVTPIEACSEVNGNWDGKIANSEADCTCKTGYVSNSAGTACQISNTPDSSQTTLSPGDCYAEGMAKEEQALNNMLNNANAQPNGLSAENEAVAEAQTSASLNTVLNDQSKALAAICGISLPAQTPTQETNGLTSQSHTDIYGAIFSALNRSKTYENNGATYSWDGNTIYSSAGTSYNVSGNIIYGSNGTAYHLDGTTFYGSDGKSYTQTGNTIYGSDGSSATEVGSTIYVQSDNK
jgi:hypothetical protein